MVDYYELKISIEQSHNGNGIFNELLLKKTMKYDFYAMSNDFGSSCLSFMFGEESNARKCLDEVVKLEGVNQAKVEPKDFLNN